MRHGFLKISCLCAGIACAALIPAVHAATKPEVYSVIEGRDSASSNPVAILIGKNLQKYREFSLFKIGVPGPQESPELLSGNSDMLVLRLPAGLAPGAYSIALGDGKHDADSVMLALSNGYVPPASVGALNLDAALRTDLDNALTLDGYTAASFLDASNHTSGTMPTDRFSAYDDLVAEGRFGTAADQIPTGAEVQAVKKLLGAKVRLSSAYTYTAIDSNTTGVPFDVEEFDTDGCHDGTNKSRLTCNTAGYYLVMAKSMEYPNAAPDRILKLLKNGTLASLSGRIIDTGSQPEDLSLTTILHLDQGDYLEMLEIKPNNQGQTRTLKEGQGMTEFMMVRIGE